MKTILCIDDSESHRYLLEEELSEEGHRVLTADNIESVLSKKTTVDPDLLILELRQKKSNEDVLSKLKRHFPKALWIGYSTYIRCPEEFKKWVRYYVQKSWRTEGLKGLIRTL